MRKMKFPSQFLTTELKEAVDTVTGENFQEVKQRIIDAMNSEGHFEKYGKHVLVFEEIFTPGKLQKTYYNYIMASEGLKTL